MAGDFSDHLVGAINYVKENGVEKSLKEALAALATTFGNYVLALIATILSFLWWRPIQRWALGINDLERRIEILERRR